MLERLECDLSPEGVAQNATNGELERLTERDHVGGRGFEVVGGRKIERIAVVSEVDEDRFPFGTKRSEGARHCVPVHPPAENAVKKEECLFGARTLAPQRMMSEPQHLSEMMKIGGQRKARCVISPLYGPSLALVRNGHPSDVAFPKREPKDRI